jgi:hypothetical protein
VVRARLKAFASISRWTATCAASCWSALRFFAVACSASHFSTRSCRLICDTRCRGEQVRAAQTVREWSHTSISLRCSIIVFHFSVTSFTAISLFASSLATMHRAASHSSSHFS